MWQGLWPHFEDQRRHIPKGVKCRWWLELTIQKGRNTFSGSIYTSLTAMASWIFKNLKIYSVVEINREDPNWSTERKTVERTEQSIRDVGTQWNAVAKLQYESQKKRKGRLGQKQYFKKMNSMNIPEGMKDFNLQIPKAQQIPKVIIG